MTGPQSVLQRGEPGSRTRTTHFTYILRETAYLPYRATGHSVAGAPGIG